MSATNLMIIVAIALLCMLAMFMLWRINDSLRVIGDNAARIVAKI